MGAVVIQAGLNLSVPGLCLWALGMGIFWDFATFSALGHHALVLGRGNVGPNPKRVVGGCIVGRASGRIDFGGSCFFCVGPFLHCWEVRAWAWPFSLNVALVIAGMTMVWSQFFWASG